MPESERILSQLEVDALLRAINAGDIPVGGRMAPAAAVAPLDLRRPQRLTRRELASIEAIHEPLARTLRDLFGPVLRGTVNVQLAGVEQVMLAEFVESIPNPTALVVGSLEPGNAQVILEIEPALAFPIVERMLGAGGPLGAPPERALREMEWQLLSRVTDAILTRIVECWAGMMVARVSVRARETSPASLRAILQDEPLVRVGFLVEGDGHRGGVSVCVPSSIAERLVARRVPAPGASTMALSALAVTQAEVEIAVRLPVEGMRMSDLEALAEGDVLVTGVSAQGEVVIEAGGAAKLLGQAGALRGRRAVLVEEWLDASRAERMSESPDRPLERRAGGAGRAGPEWRRVLSASVELRAIMAERGLSIREVLQMRPGAVIQFERRPSDPIRLEAGGRPFATGAPVRVGDRVGIQIASVQDPQKTVRNLA